MPWIYPMALSRPKAFGMLSGITVSDLRFLGISFYCKRHLPFSIMLGGIHLDFKKRKSFKVLFFPDSVIPLKALMALYLNYAF